MKKLMFAVAVWVLMSATWATVAWYLIPEEAVELHAMATGRK